MEEANELIHSTLNRQTELLWEWREKLVSLLTQPLSSSSSDGDADGEEFSRSLETQGEAEAYLQAYADLFADRRATLTSERTLLAAHDTRETHLRKTKAAQKATDTVLWAEDEDLMDVQMEKLEGEVQPQHEVLQKELKEKRTALLQLNDAGAYRAVRSVMVDLNNVAARIVKEDDPERYIVKDAVAKLRALINEQCALFQFEFILVDSLICTLLSGKSMEKLQLDLVLLRRAFNERISCALFSFVD